MFDSWHPKSKELPLYTTLPLHTYTHTQTHTCPHSQSSSYILRPSGLDLKWSNSYPYAWINLWEISISLWKTVKQVIVCGSCLWLCVWSMFQIVQQAGVGASAIHTRVEDWTTKLLGLCPQAYNTNLCLYYRFLQFQSICFSLLLKEYLPAGLWHLSLCATDSQALPRNLAQTRNLSHRWLACGHPALEAKGV